ncbi:MAG: DegV family protein [Lachnospiraceae bacterium]|nr:DegV family protein [Lachnospiraceae bacterium]
MFKVLVDSCGELTKELDGDSRFVNVPLTLEVDGYRIIDDETFDQADFLRRVRESESGPKSSCPSPEAYLKLFEGEAEHIYGITLSAVLSGSYNSAMVAKQMYEEKHDDKKIHIFNSKSASIGETLIALKIKECEESGMSFEEVIKNVDEYIATQHTFFVLETLETLRKNGRLSHLKAFVAGALNIKPVMGSTDEGNIQQLAKTRGMTKGLKKMAEEAIRVTPDPENRILAISHCNAPEKAELVKNEMLKYSNYKEIIVLDTNGVSSMYASDGGVIMVL